MRRFTQKQRRTARERFLVDHPEIKKRIDSMSEDDAKQRNCDLEEWRSLETMIAIDDYAEKNHLDDQELFLYYIADSLTEFQQLVTEWRSMIADIDRHQFPVSSIASPS